MSPKGETERKNAQNIALFHQKSCDRLTRSRSAHTFRSVDDVEEAEYGDGNSYSWSVYNSSQRLREVDVGFHIPPVISNPTNIKTTLLTTDLKYTERNRNDFTLTSGALQNP